MTQAATELHPEGSVLLHRRDARGVHQLTPNTPASFNVLATAARRQLVAQEGVQAFIEKRKPQWPA